MLSFSVGMITLDLVIILLFMLRTFRDDYFRQVRLSAKNHRFDRALGAVQADDF